MRKMEGPMQPAGRFLTPHLHSVYLSVKHQIVSAYAGSHSGTDVHPCTAFGWLFLSCLSGCGNTPSRATENGRSSLPPRPFALLTRRPAWLWQRITHCAVTGCCCRCTLTRSAKCCWEPLSKPCRVAGLVCSCTSVRMLVGSGVADPTLGRPSVWKREEGLVNLLTFHWKGLTSKKYRENELGKWQRNKYRYRWTRKRQETA